MACMTESYTARDGLRRGTAALNFHSMASWFCRRSRSFRLLALILSFSLIHSKDKCERFLESNKPHRSIYLNTTQKAGLYDRYNIIHGLLHLAKYTRSHVYIPPPCKLLNVQHNNNSGISCKLKWSDFLDVSEFSNVLLKSKPTRPDLSIRAYYRECLSWLSSGPAKAYELLTAAPIVKVAAIRFIQKWLPGPFSFIHFRFGSHHENCDQSHRAILTRLSELRGKLKLAGKYLAVASNHRLHPPFIKEVATTTNATVVWVDPILQNSTDARISDNNYLIFNLEVELMKRAMYKIVWHRTFECGDVECVLACRNVSHTDASHTRNISHANAKHTTHRKL